MPIASENEIVKTETSSDAPFSLPLDALLLVLMVLMHLWFSPFASALIVTLVGLYLLLAVLFPNMPDEMQAPRRSDRYVLLIRLSIVFFILMAAAILPVGLAIMNRHAQGPATNANDGMIQVEEAAKFLIAGKNPYAENYLNTPMADWKGGEPPWTTSPLYHNAYFPLLFLPTVPAYLLSVATLGWYDQRFLYLLLYVGLLVMLPVLIRRQRDKLSLLIAIGLNYYFTYMLADGRNDIVVLFGLVLVTLLLARRHVQASAVVLGLTLATKQTSWFFLPFYLLYLAPAPLTFQSVRSVLRKTWPLIPVAVLPVVPFLIWDAPAFIDDTVLFLFGLSPDSYPIRGVGLSSLLVGARLVTAAGDKFPFGLVQILVSLPVLVIMLVRQWRRNTLQFVWLGFATFSLVLEYFSRFFNDNYLLFDLQALVIAAFLWPHRWQDDAPTIEPAPAVSGDPQRRLPGGS